MTGSILIVDDEPANLATLRQVLSPEHSLIFARSGKEALAACVKHRPALVLLDVIMPEMDGYEVCRKLKENPETAHIPIIFVTGLTEVGDEMRGFEVGAVDYIMKPISPPVVCARVRLHLSLVSASQLEQSYHEAISMLGEAGEYKDADTGLHIWRMASYSRALAAEAGWSASECQKIELAAPMHDVGKVAIPDAVLRKPGKLDETEWVIMKTHSIIGYHILSRSQAPILRMAATIARSHHEKWNGTGYPDGLAGDDIPEIARIVAIADVFDALTMLRPYKDAWPIDRVIETMTADAGTHFHPNPMKHFNNIMPDILALKDDWQKREAAAHQAS